MDTHKQMPWYAKKLEEVYKIVNTSEKGLGDLFGGLNNSIQGLKIGLPKEYFCEGIDPEIKDAAYKAAKELEELHLDTASIMKLIQAVNPDVKKIGLLYDIGQDSSTTAIQEAKDYLDKEGIEYVERTGTTTDEVQLAADALVADGVDAVFTPTDNTIMTAELSIYEKFIDAGIPQYTGADSFALNGAFVGYGVDYANLGQKTADMIADILMNDADSATTSVETFDNGTATVNTETCEGLGLDLETVKKDFEPLCTQVNEIVTAESFDDVEK